MNPKKSSNQMKEVRERTVVIMKVQGGILTATDAAKQLGISRKTYYELEARALSGIMQAINPGQTGRPKNAVDPEKLAMQKEINSKYELNLKRASSGSKKQGFIDTGFDCIRGAAYGLQYDPA